VRRQPLPPVEPYRLGPAGVRPEQRETVQR
jgi:hypothetical protein